MIFKNKYNFMLFMLLIISIILSITTNSWFFMWMGLEFNLITFIMLIILKNSSEWSSAMKYFLIQSLSSSMFIYFSLLNYLIMNNYLIKVFLIFLNIALLIKIGVFPFYKWYPNLMNQLDWINCFILSTMQKLSPLIILSYKFNYTLLIILIMFNYLLSNLMMMNYSSMRMIFSYSSIGHSSWMILSLMKMMYLFNLYFMVYFYMTMMMFYYFMLNKINYLMDLYMNMNYKIFEKIMISFLMLSFMSFPFFIGFIIKWFLMLFMLEQMIKFIVFLMLMFSLISTFNYIRLFMFMIMQNLLMNKIIMFKKYNLTKKYYLILYFMSLIFLFFCGLNLI
uniref:NADH-ubiquinone oxidoreductase chain 2 n=1 Tax=Taeniogonalos taihorina TaxID=1515605 RepID=A0A0K0KBI3_9HYME|nr:NADH dehydrogenase subunit 2 [Taeniogonalos taihorina]AIE11784.1 NADH dehydrogenase subunit 2 [Taeniogonalos taihorina]